MKTKSLSNAINKIAETDIGSASPQDIDLVLDSSVQHIINRCANDLFDDPDILLAEQMNIKNTEVKFVKKFLVRSLEAGLADFVKNYSRR